MDVKKTAEVWYDTADRLAFLVAPDSYEPRHACYHCAGTYDLHRAAIKAAQYEREEWEESVAHRALSHIRAFMRKF